MIKNGIANFLKKFFTDLLVLVLICIRRNNQVLLKSTLRHKYTKLINKLST